MNQDDFFLAEIIAEFDRIIPHLRNAQYDLGRKFYYFSALHGVINRVLNFKYDQKLLFIHNILANAHAAFASRIDNMASGKERGILIHPEIVDALFSSIEGLRDKLAAKKDTTDLLERISVLTYITTGNGCYLYEKGHIKL